MPQGGRFKLTLRKLDFISPVDEPAQETAKVCLIKRGKGDNIAITARVAKVDDSLGLVFGWAFTSTIDGEPYWDLQGDQIDEDFIKAAADFMIDGGLTDEMHDSVPDGRVVFCMPLTAEIAKSFGVESDTTGLMVALKPSAEVFAKFKSGEYTGFSIAGSGEREANKAKTIKCEKCSAYMAKDADKCPSCGTATPTKRPPVDKATWSTAYVDDLPDSAFLYVEGGGTKDSDGKTTPRSLRHFPYKDVNGKVDVAHLRDATGRIPQSSLPASLKERIQQKAEKLLAAQHADKRAGVTTVAKHAYLTTAVAGHTHILDHDNGQAAGYTDYAPMDADGSGYHQHPWVRNTTADTFVLGEAAGHTHEVLPQEQIDALVAAGDADVDEDDQITKLAALTASAKGKAMPDPKVEELTKKLEKRDAEIERLKKKYAMTDAQRAYYKSLERDEDKTAYLEKSSVDRDADVKKFDESSIVYKSKDGRVYRHDDDIRLVEMAKSMDAQAEVLAKRDAELETERLTKRAGAEIPNLPGKVEDKIALLKALDAVPEANRAGVKAMVAAGQNALAPMFKGIGHVGNGQAEVTNGQEQLDALVKAHAEKNNVDQPAAYGAVLKTAEGRRLYTAIEAAKRAGN